MNRRARIAHYRSSARAEETAATFAHLRAQAAALRGEPNPYLVEDAANHRRRAAHFRARARALALRPYLVFALAGAACLLAVLAFL